MLGIVRIVTLGLWVGALAGFAFFFAPIAFAHVGPTPSFAATIAACVVTLARLGWFLGAIALAAAFADRRVPRAALLALSIGVVLAIGCSIVEVLAVVPQMEATPLATPAYEALHRESSLVYGCGFLAALAAFVAASWRPAYR